MVLLYQAIGLRMTCENEADQRNRQRRAIQAQINEKRAELDRYVSKSLTNYNILECIVLSSLNIFILLRTIPSFYVYFFFIRIMAQCQSLERIEAEQNIQLERLNCSQNT